MSASLTGERTSTILRTPINRRPRSVPRPWASAAVVWGRWVWRARPRAAPGWRPASIARCRRCGPGSPGCAAAAPRCARPHHPRPCWDGALIHRLWAHGGAVLWAVLWAWACCAPSRAWAPSRQGPRALGHWHGGQRCRRRCGLSWSGGCWDGGGRAPCLGARGPGKARGRCCQWARTGVGGACGVGVGVALPHGLLHGVGRTRTHRLPRGMKATRALRGVDRMERFAFIFAFGPRGYAQKVKEIVC
jgi:hypothetical protein